MVQSKGWDWENADHSHWLKPSEESVYLAHKWRESNFHDILDLGTGLGRHAIYFAKQGFRVSALDISEYGVAHLQSWAENEGLAVDARVGDMLVLPYPDNAFDCVFAYHVISHTDTAGVRAIFTEIERVLRPQGEVFLTFCSKETTDFMEPGLPRPDANTVIRQSEPENGVPHFFVDLQDLRGLFRSFDIEKARHLEYCVLDPQHTFQRKYYYVNARLR